MPSILILRNSYNSHRPSPDVTIINLAKVLALAQKLSEDLIYTILNKIIPNTIGKNYNR